MTRVPVTRGDVVWVSLVGAVGAEKKGHGQDQERPCVVVQNDGGNSGSPLTIVAPITDGSAYKGYSMQVQVAAGELGPGGKDSVVECGHLRSIDQDFRVDPGRGVTAHLSAATMTRIDRALRASLSL